MGEGIGSYLRELRAAQRLTTTQLAQKAGIRRATLSEWQAGKRQPRLPELERVLDVLSVTDRQRRVARELLRTPGNLLRLREEVQIHHPELAEAAGRPPQGGDLLRAMRMRKGWTQAQLAQALGVTQTKAARWELSESWMDAETLQRLCYLLGAREEELTALTMGRFSLREGQPLLTPEAIQEELRSIFDQRFSPLRYGLTELRLLTLMAHAWELATERDAARLLLAEVQDWYTDHLFMQRRFSEARVAANRALDLYSAMQVRNEKAEHAAIRLAQASAQSGSQYGRESAIALLRQWLPGTKNPTLAGWMLRNLAELQADNGRLEEALRLSWEALQRTQETDNPFNLVLRYSDHARLLLRANRSREAQESLIPDPYHPYCRLAEAQVHHESANPEQAHRLVQEVMADIEFDETLTQPERTYYRPEAETLAERLAGAKET